MSQLQSNEGFGSVILGVSLGVSLDPIGLEGSQKG